MLLLLDSQPSEDLCNAEKGDSSLEIYFSTYNTQIIHTYIHTTVYIHAQYRVPHEKDGEKVQRNGVCVSVCLFNVLK